ncbi:MAG: hypothetical protein L0229_29695 [Blastocatellia bacterium]|nr:hypothetical protein [Blastocatellia bacterium]
MANTCTICKHPNRLDIERAIARRESLRNIAKQFQVGYSAVNRHQSCIAAELEEVREAGKLERAVSIETELANCFARVNRLLDACDAWLRDPDDPARYDIGPRAEEVTVIYTVENGDGPPLRKKDSMADLLGQLASRGLDVQLIEVKHADPRELFLNTIRTLHSEIDILAKLRGAYVKKAPHPDELEQKRRFYTQTIEGAINSTEAKTGHKLTRAQAVAIYVHTQTTDEILEFVTLSPSETAEMRKELAELRGER